MKLTKDKIKHLVISFLIMVLTSVTLYQFKSNIHFALGISILFTLTVGLVKEFIYDYYLGKGQLSIYDLAYNFIGVYLGVIISAIIVS